MADVLSESERGGVKIIKDPHMHVDGNYIGVYLEGEGTALLEVSCDEFNRIYKHQNRPRYEKIAKIREAASVGLDMSPGDPIAQLAIEVIDSYIKEVDELLERIVDMGSQIK